MRFNLETRAGGRVDLHVSCHLHLTEFSFDLKQRANFSDVLHYLNIMEIWSADLEYSEYPL